MVEIPRPSLRFIEYSSAEYHQATQLRYRLFYQHHDIPVEALFISQEQHDLHAVIVSPLHDSVLAYGRLGQNRDKEFQLYQLVVEPEWQGQGLGTQIVQALTEAAAQQGASLLVLNARVMQTGFYQQFGFEPVGDVFLSPMTSIPHIKMQKHLGR
jgi:predicted GNAT family N-acyltransferase